MGLVLVITQPQQIAGTPVLSPGAGTYSTAQTVMITAAGTIYYTIDGSIPTPASSVYSVPLTVSVSQVIQAIAYVPGFIPSGIADASYTISIAGSVYDGTAQVNASGVLVNSSNVPITGVGFNASGLETSCVQGYQPWYDSPPDWTTLFALFSPIMVRLPVNEASWLGYTCNVMNAGATAWASTGVNASGPAGMAAYRQAVVNAAGEIQSRGAYVMFDDHWCAPDFTFGGVRAHTMPSFGQPAFMNSDTSGVFHTSFASYFGTEATPQVANLAGGGTFTLQNAGILMDLFNEPFLDGGLGWNSTTWAAMKAGGSTIPNFPLGNYGGTTVAQSWVTYGYQQALNVWRSPGHVNVLVTGGGGYSSNETNYASWMPVDTLTPPQLCVGAHPYQVLSGLSNTTDQYPQGNSNWVANSGALAVIAAKIPLLFTEDGGYFNTVAAYGATETHVTYMWNWCVANGVPLYISWCGQNGSGGAAPGSSGTNELVYATTPPTLTGGQGECFAAIAASLGAPAVATPVFTPAAGKYTSPQNVTTADSTPGSTIFYTKDGTTPTTGSAVYSSPIPVSTTQTIQAIATAPGYTQSGIGSSAYTINLPVAGTPSYSPAAGTYTIAQNVALSSTTAGATIYYTEDGTTPTTASPVYSTPLAISANTVIKAFSAKSGYTSSGVSSSSYTINIQAATPTLSPGAGSYSGPQTIAISDSTPGAVIYYTTNGSTPTTGSTKYTAPFTLSASATVNAIATAPGYTTSNVGSAAYGIGTSTLLMYANGATGPVWNTAQDLSYGGTFNYQNTSNLEAGHSYNFSMSGQYAGWLHPTNWAPQYQGGTNGYDISSCTWWQGDIFATSGNVYNLTSIFMRGDEVQGADVNEPILVSSVASVPGVGGLTPNAWNYNVKVPLAYLGLMSDYNLYKWGLQQSQAGPTLCDNVKFIAGNTGWVYRGNPNLESGWTDTSALTYPTLITPTSNNDGPGAVQTGSGINMNAAQAIPPGNWVVAHTTSSTYGGQHNGWALTDLSGNTYTVRENLEAASDDLNISQQSVLYSASITTALTTLTNAWDITFGTIGDRDYMAGHAWNFSGVTGWSGSTIIARNGTGAGDGGGVAPGSNNLLSQSLTLTSAQVPCTLYGICFNQSWGGTTDGTGVNSRCPTIGSTSTAAGATSVENYWDFAKSPSIPQVSFIQQKITVPGTYTMYWNQTNVAGAVDYYHIITFALQGANVALANYNFLPNTIASGLRAVNNPPTAASNFSGHISGTNLVIDSGSTQGPVKPGQQLYYNSCPANLQILSGSGTSFTLSQNLGTVTSQNMMSVVAQINMPAIKITTSASSATWKVSYAAGYSLTPYTYFTFAALPTKTGNDWQVQFYNTSGGTIGTAISANQAAYTSGDFGVSTVTYTIFCIPLSALGVSGTIGGFSIKDTSGNATNAFLFSQVGFFS